MLQWFCQTAFFCLCSWLKKLQLVKDVLVDTTAGAPDLNTLANAYIYLQVYCLLLGPSHTAAFSRILYRARKILAGGQCQVYPAIYAHLKQAAD